MPTARTRPNSVSRLTDEAHDRHRREGADDGHRHRGQRDQRRPPRLQEQISTTIETRMIESRSDLKTSAIDSRMNGRGVVTDLVQ